MARAKNPGHGPGLDNSSHSSVGTQYFLRVCMPLSSFASTADDTFPLFLNYEPMLFLDPFQEGASSFTPIY